MNEDVTVKPITHYHIYANKRIFKKYKASLSYKGENEVISKPASDQTWSEILSPRLISTGLITTIQCDSHLLITDL